LRRINSNCLDWSQFKKDFTIQEGFFLNKFEHIRDEYPQQIIIQIWNQIEALFNRNEFDTSDEVIQKHAHFISRKEYEIKKSKALEKFRDNLNFSIEDRLKK